MLSISEQVLGQPLGHLVVGNDPLPGTCMFRADAPNVLIQNPCRPLEDTRRDPARILVSQ